MPRLKFTAKSVAAIDIPPKRSIFWDEFTTGFGLRISPSGQKTWVAMYRVMGTGRQKFYTVGAFAKLPLADARAMAKEVLYRSSKGEDPAQDKVTSRLAESFAELASEYIERHAKVNKRSWAADERMLKADVLPYWANFKAKEIRRRDVIALLDRHITRGTPILANRVLALTRKIFNFGLQREIVEFNPCQAVKRPFDERQRQGQRVLNFEEIRAVAQAMEAEDGLTAAIFKLRLFTAQRGKEIRSMAWSDVDLESGWWTIPGSKTKNKLDHRVPITPQIRSILDSISWTKKQSRFIFPSPTNSDAHIDNIQKAFQRLKGRAKVDFWDRDLRRTAASYMTGNLGFPRLVVSKILNHVESGITRVYDRHSYDREKRTALQSWNDLVDQIVAEKCEPKVIQISNLIAG